ncbi:histidinol-phosphatase (PHP family) [Selenomonas sp. GACV-9]|uniref:histidinol-phosphatase HisJ family protein n=1 Tax=Selenomonas sp. GACV-9 TaxID=3158782 RepID=UPI0008F0B34D|nr:histidinol-phosphatase (PHP family) [Selenomonas ruminantium]
MLFDSHSHTEFSGDSEMKAQDAMAAAEKLGLGLVFTEHLDLDYPGEIDFTFNPDEYWHTYEHLRGSRLRLGVEVGMQASTCDRSREFTEWLPFDLVIGAIHMVDGQDIYYKEAYGNLTKAEFYHKYYQSMAANVRSHTFIDVLAHIDYIARYAPYENPEVEYGSFQEDIDEVLRAVIETDTVLELNTRRLGSRRALKELVPIYTRYRELGGRYVTLGSDAHTADAIGAHFAVAVDFAEALGLQPVTFCGRLRESCQK